MSAAYARGRATVLGQKISAPGRGGNECMAGEERGDGIAEVVSGMQGERV